MVTDMIVGIQIRKCCVQVIKVLSNAAKAKNMIKNLIDNFEKHIDPNDPTNNCLESNYNCARKKN